MSAPIASVRAFPIVVCLRDLGRCAVGRRPAVVPLCVPTKALSSIFWRAAGPASIPAQDPYQSWPYIESEEAVKDQRYYAMDFLDDKFYGCATAAQARSRGLPPGSW